MSLVIRADIGSNIKAITPSHSIAYPSPAKYILWQNRKWLDQDTYHFKSYDYLRDEGCLET